MAHMLQRCSTCHFPPLRPAVTQIVPKNAVVRRARLAVAMQAWTQVVDQASGKPYYWNTDTNETAWEVPTQQPATTAVSEDTTTTTSSTTSTSGSTASDPTAADEQQQQMSSEALFDALAAAYSADGSGMGFWEVARAHRQYGVFDPPFFPDYLEQRQRAAGSEAERELAFKMMCRLSNPLLRQPAPFE